MKSTEFIIENSQVKVVKQTDFYTIRKVDRARPDDTVETKFEVLDPDGVTRKILNTFNDANAWARANWIYFA
jgi:hypothetical protein